GAARREIAGPERRRRQRERQRHGEADVGRDDAEEARFHRATERDRKARPIATPIAVRRGACDSVSRVTSDPATVLNCARGSWSRTKAVLAPRPAIEPRSGPAPRSDPSRFPVSVRGLRLGLGTWGLGGGARGLGDYGRKVEHIARGRGVLRAHGDPEATRT